MAPKKSKSSEPSAPATALQKKKRSREEEKSAPCFLSNDGGHLWTDWNPDVALIEPRILVSVNYNYLAFHRKANKPPESRSLTLINHGDYPIAFKVETTDNISYFVDRRNGIIPPKQTIVNAAIRMPNTVTIEVYHRPHNEYLQGQQNEFYNRPRKDKMTIMLAPQMCQTFAPEAIFHYERCYEKLRIALGYLGTEEKQGDKPVKKQLLLHGVPGWATWKEENGARQKKNERQIAEFRKIEKTIIQNASKEQCEDLPKHPIPVCRQSPAVYRGRTPMPLPGGRRHPKMQRKFRSISPFNRTPTMKKTQSETPKKSNEPSLTPRAAAVNIITPLKTSLENQKTPIALVAGKKTSAEGPKKSNEAPSPGITPLKKSMENEIPPSPKQHSKKKSLENECPPSPTLLKMTPTTPNTKMEVASPKTDQKSQERPQTPPAHPHPTPPSKNQESAEPNSKTPKPDVHSPVAIGSPEK